MDTQRKPIPNVERLKYHGTAEKPDIKIFVSERIDTDSVLVEGPVHIPVRCGAVYDERDYEKGEITTLGDDTGENVSEKRIELSELTVMYWAWKNINADYYGFCHYRRYFSFTPRCLQEDPRTLFVQYKRLNEEAIEELHLNDEAQIRKMVEPYDLVVTDPWDVQESDFHPKNLYEQFGNIPGGNIEDMRLGISILKKLYPEYSKAADRYMNGTKLYICNLFIMKKDLFQRYANWLFSILAEVEKNLQGKQYSVHGQRTLGHIGERLFGVFYTHLVANHPEYKIGKLQRAMFEHTERNEFPTPHWEEKNIPIVVSSSDYFAPYLFVTLQSLLDCASANRNYDIIVLETDFSAQNKQSFYRLTQNKENVSLRFVNVAPIFEDKPLTPHSHFSVFSFFRLAISEVCAAYDSVLYLDSDLIIKRDVAELYGTDIGDNFMAGVIDYTFLAMYYHDRYYWEKYVSSKLRLNEENLSENYFQAGVLLFNLKMIRECFKSGELVKFACENDFIHQEQDILSVVFKGHTKRLNAKWNVVTDDGGDRVPIMKDMPYRCYYEYMESRDEPYIIHFSGPHKPWTMPWSDFSPEFWSVARKTPYYEVILQRMLGGGSGGIYVGENSSVQWKSGARKFADKFLPKGTRRREFAKKLLPKGSKRWNFCKKIYYFIFRR